MAQGIKNSPAMHETQGITGSISWSGRCLEETAATSSILVWGKPHRQRSLANYSPRGARVDFVFRHGCANINISFSFHYTLAIRNSR